MKIKNFIHSFSTIFNFYPVRREIMRVDYLNPLKIVKEDNLYHITDGNYYLSINNLLLCHISWIDSECIYSDSKGECLMFSSTEYRKAKSLLESLEYNKIMLKSQEYKEF